MLAMITKEQILAWSPKAKPKYIEALLAGEADLRAAGILDDKLTLTHFMAQVGGETDGLTILREDLNYKTVGAIRRAWKARAAKHSDEWIKENLLNNPKRLGGWAYGGRMGNEPWPSQDGYDYRGGGWIQTTGRYAVETYCRKLGIKPRPDILDDFSITLKFACFEWKETGCNTYACQNDILRVSKIINTGSAKSGVMPNGMENRRYWLREAWRVWGDAANMTVPAASGITAEDLKKQGSQTIAHADTLRNLSGVAAAASALAGGAKNAAEISDPTAAPLPLIDNDALTEQMRKATESADIFTAFATSAKAAVNVATSNLWVFGLVCGVVGVVLALNIRQRRVADARLGLHSGRIPDPGPLKGSDVPAETPAETPA